jgi:hypothetical protein
VRLTAKATHHRCEPTDAIIIIIFFSDPSTVALACEPSKFNPPREQGIEPTTHLTDASLPIQILHTTALRRPP